jgi:hypothetical protein
MLWTISHPVNNRWPSCGGELVVRNQGKMVFCQTAPHATEPLQKLAHILVGKTVNRAAYKDKRVGKSGDVLEELGGLAGAYSIIISDTVNEIAGRFLCLPA